jgi:hypothetical protein
MFDGLTVPSWQSNLLDVAISGGQRTGGGEFLGQHDPATVGVAFEPPLPGGGFLTQVTFLDEFIPTAPVLSQVSGTPGPDQAPALPARATTALAAAVDDPLLIFEGMAEGSGGRFVRFGSGVPLPNGDPSAIHAVPGDVNDDGCVDTADFDRIQQLIGQPVTHTQPETFPADVNLDGVIDARDYLLLKRNYGQGCATPPAPLPLLSQALFGFEDPTNWISPKAPLLRVGAHTEGAFGLQVGDQYWRPISSVPFDTSLFTGVTSTVAYDIQVPATPANPYWLGQTLLFASCPSAGIYNAYLGAFELTGKPLGQFATARFHVPWWVKAAMLSSHPDFSFTIVVNSFDASVIDNLRFVK